MNVKMGFEDDLEDHLDFFTNQEQIMSKFVYSPEKKAKESNVQSKTTI